MSDNNIDGVIERARTAASELASWAEAMRGVVDALPLTSPEDEKRAVGFVRKMREAKAKAEEERKELKEPFHTASTTIDELFRGPRRAIESMESMLKSRLEKLTQERQAKIREAQRKEREAREAAAQATRLAALATRSEEQAFAEDAQAAIDDARAAKQEQAEIRDAGPKGVSARTTWTFDVTDLAKVPIGFLQLNEAAVRAYLAALPAGEEPAVPGLAFTSKTTTVIR